MDGARPDVARVEGFLSGVLRWDVDLARRVRDDQRGFGGRDGHPSVSSTRRPSSIVTHLNERSLRSGCRVVISGSRGRWPCGCVSVGGGTVVADSSVHPSLVPILVLSGLCKQRCGLAWLFLLIALISPRGLLDGIDMKEGRKGD